jgi:chromosome segregation ATPase
VFGIEIPVVVSLLTAVGALVMGYLAHRRGKQEADAKSLDVHLTALREMYRELVEDLRAEIDRLQEENRRLRATIQELHTEAAEALKRERSLQDQVRRLIEVGQRGPVGKTGEKGATGETGETGPQGRSGN